ncbi:Inositol 1,4,5-trisphosphate receptor type 3 [Cichlidogyrus casuarinus]|uniref:Inositol 1,4,5-trisphosphate receptor type 3 n=1 Tax=Cichlidogyrus casuarinus TaxID=1844966 RepID=A0ABD2QGV0_9PLAT
MMRDNSEICSIINKDLIRHFLKTPEIRKQYWMEFTKVALSNTGVAMPQLQETFLNEVIIVTQNSPLLDLNKMKKKIINIVDQNCDKSRIFSDLQEHTDLITVLALCCYGRNFKTVKRVAVMVKLDQLVSLLEASYSVLPFAQDEDTRECLSQLRNSYLILLRWTYGNAGIKLVLHEKSPIWKVFNAISKRMEYFRSVYSEEFENTFSLIKAFFDSSMVMESDQFSPDNQALFETLYKDICEIMGEQHDKLNPKAVHLLLECKKCMEMWIDSSCQDYECQRTFADHDDVFLSPSFDCKSFQQNTKNSEFQRTLSEMQTFLDKNGVSTLCISLLMSQVRTKGILHESVLLAKALLNGGNESVQHTFLSKLSTNPCSEHYFQMIQKKLQQLENHYKSKRATFCKMSGKLCNILRVLQLLCENHNRSFQPKNAVSYNLVGLTMQLFQASLSGLFSRENPDDDERMGYSELISPNNEWALELLAKLESTSNDFIMQLLNTLIEYCQGPCHKNQDCLTRHDSNGIDTIISIILLNIRCNGSTYQKAVTFGIELKVSDWDTKHLD